MIEYRSFEDMSRIIRENIGKFPHDVEAVLGVPRSGMIPAYLVGLYLNKPVADINSFAAGNQTFAAGARDAFIRRSQSRKILVVDDSYRRGHAYKKVRDQLKHLDDMQFIYAAIFTTAEGVDVLDVWCEVLTSHRVFEWNVFHHSMLSKAALDIDGVLCEDPPVDDDGEQYLAYIRHATPKFIPSYPVKMLVTCRLEKYRAATEAWLAEQGVVFEKLVMLDMPDKATRQKWGRHGYYKGEVYSKSDCELFIESSLRQARQIMHETDKPIFCTETMTMLQEGGSVKKALTQADVHRRIFAKQIRKWFRHLLHPADGHME